LGLLHQYVFLWYQNRAVAVVKEKKCLIQNSKKALSRLWMSWTGLMQMKLEASLYATEGQIEINLAGGDRAYLITDQGETLFVPAVHPRPHDPSAISGTQDLHVLLDSDGFMFRHEEDLRKMAHRAMQRVRRERRRVKLPPLNPYDRRIVHMEVAESRDLDSVPKGEWFHEEGDHSAEILECMKTDTEDTIAAIANTAGRSALGIVRISGSRCRTILPEVFQPRHEQEVPAFRPVLGRILFGNQQFLDEASVTFFQGPIRTRGKIWRRFPVMEILSSWRRSLAGSSQPALVWPCPGSSPFGHS